MAKNDTIAEDAVLPVEAGEDEAVRRVYEVGYLVLPTVAEEEIEGVVAEIRNVIEKGEGSFIAEGAPVRMTLAYPMFVNRGGKRDKYDRAAFGWIKFEATGMMAQELHTALSTNQSILRFIIFKTIREDTRASARRAVLREVRRTDTIASAPKKGAEEGAGEVSEEALDKSIEDLIKE